MNAFIRLLYALLIAVSVAVFIGVGIASVYQPPKQPDYTSTYSEADMPSEEIDRRSREYEDIRKEYDEKNRAYQTNVTIALLPIAALVTVAGLWLMRRSEVIGEGLALGGIATSIYAIITASMADERVLRFLAVTLLLAGTIMLAHRRSLSGDTIKKP